MTTIFDTATCIGCGCDDDHACMQGCGWLRVNRHIGRGVCTSCPDKLGTWDEGDYAFALAHGDARQAPEAVERSASRVTWWAIDGELVDGCIFALFPIDFPIQFGSRVAEKLHETHVACQALHQFAEANGANSDVLRVQPPCGNL